MGERVMDANVAAEVWARRMVRSWNPVVARAEHLRSLKRYQEQKTSLNFITETSPQMTLMKKINADSVAR